MSETIENQTPETPVEQQAAPEAQVEQQEEKKDSYHELPDWARKRMGELAAQKNAAKEELARYQAQLAQAQSQPIQQPQFQSQDELMKAAERIAAEKLAQQTFVQRMTQIESTAKEQYGEEYDKAISNLSLAGVQSNDFLQALAEIPNPEKVLVYLGRSDNVNEAIRVANLSPMQMGIEMTKLSQKAAKELSKQRSSAPAPIGEVGGSSSSSNGGAEPPISDTQAWMAWRNKTKKAR